MSQRDSLTTQRSAWQALEPMLIEDAPGHSYRRNVSDGFLTAILTTEPHGLHLSVAHHNHPARKQKANRYPTWDEIAQARYVLCPHDIDMVLILPALEDYVALHPTTFHLHQVVGLPNSATDRAKNDPRGRRPDGQT